MRYELFLSDFDGTLLRSDGSISERTRNAITRFRRAGGIFAVCTGRGPAAILPRLHEIGLHEGLVAAFQGAVIADIATGEALTHSAFCVEDACEVLEFFEGEGAHIHAYTLEDFFCNRRDELLGIYERTCGVTAEVISEQPLSQKTAREGLAVIKILVMVLPQEQDALFKRTERALAHKYFVTRSSEWLIEVLPKGQNKGAAVAQLSRRYAIPRERIAAVGDEWNDLEMLEAAGGRFAVANAVEPLKRIAVVLPSNDEDGVAYALENYAMGEEK